VSVSSGSGSASPTTTCPACGAAAFNAATGTCTRCGYAAGETNRCPHCNAVARTEGAGQASVCAVCGAPRIPGNFGGDASVLALREQKKHLGKARLASIATVLQALFAAIATLIGLAILPEAIMGKVIVFAIAVIPIILALRSRSRATAARESAKEASERAWQAAAEDVAAQAKGSGVTASALGKTLGIESAYADKLLTQLTVHDRTRIDVGDDEEGVRYSVAPVAPDQLVRIDDTHEEAELAAEIEAAAAKADAEKKERA
jgi:hypothetical protein